METIDIEKNGIWDSVLSKDFIINSVTALIIICAVLIIVKLICSLIRTEKDFVRENTSGDIDTEKIPENNSCKNGKHSRKISKRKKVRKIVTSENMLASTLRRLGILILCVITIAFVLEVNGIHISTFFAGLGILSAIVGLALQDFLKDVIMGFHILAGKFFEMGEVVEYGDFQGEVIKFSLITTKLRNIYDQSEMTICNRNISEIVMLSTQVDLDLPLSYEENVGEVHRLLQEACRKIAEVDGIESAVYLGTNSFEESAVIYKLRFFCDPKDKPQKYRDALAVVQNDLNAAGMHVPYNQLDVHQR